MIYDGYYIPSRDQSQKPSSKELLQEGSKGPQLRLDFVTKSVFWGCPVPYVDLDSSMSPIVLKDAKQTFLSETKQKDYEQHCWRLFDINQKLYPQAADTDGYQDKTLLQVLTSLK